MNLIQAMQNKTYTENGMPTGKSSGSKVLDFFYKAPASNDFSAMTNLFIEAYNEDHVLATKALFYLRDIRGGQGRREMFRKIFQYLCIWHPSLACQIYEYIPEYGRWDDLLVGLNSMIEEVIGNMILWHIGTGNNLAAKWMPRDNKAGKANAIRLQKLWNMTPKQYRKFLVEHTNVVENQMCLKNWQKIIYEHVPSKAMLKYHKAFGRNDEDRLIEYLSLVNAGKKKINAGTIYPHEIVHKILYEYDGENKTYQALWNNLPNFVKESNFIPVCDVSESMEGTPMGISIALGMYLSERNIGPFKDAFITFSEKPRLEYLQGDLFSKLDALYSADWGYNTNLEAVFNLILEAAATNYVKPEDMPKNILIISDMQFDRCTKLPSNSAMQMIQYMYISNGYAVPNIIFWNVRDSNGVPVSMHESGAALISGYSPSIMQYLGLDEITPYSVMLKTLNSKRYERIKVE